MHNRARGLHTGLRSLLKLSATAGLRRLSSRVRSFSNVSSKFPEALNEPKAPIVMAANGPESLRLGLQKIALKLGPIPIFSGPMQVLSVYLEPYRSAGGSKLYYTS